ncbi:hypothetical protein Tco_1385496 [Tanacetum coccineum]
MAAKQTMKFASQCVDWTMDTVVFHGNNYFWCTAVTYDPEPPTDNFVARPLKEFKIKFSVMNGKNSLTLDYKTFVKATGHDYNNDTYVSHPSPEAVKAEFAKIAIDANLSSMGTTLPLSKFIPCVLAELLGIEYTQNQKFRFLLGVLSNLNFSKDPSKVTEFELTTSMIAVNNQEHSLSPLPFSRNKKKGKSQTMSKLNPRHKVLRLLEHCLKRGKRPRLIRPPMKPLKHNPLGMAKAPDTDEENPNPNRLEGNTQPAVKGSHSPLDEGTRKSQPLPEGTTTDPKDSRGNIPPVDKGLPSTVPDEGTGKTMPLSEGPHGIKTQRDLNHPLSNRFEVSVPDQNKGKPSYEGELGNQPLILSTAADLQALILSDEGLMEESEDDVFEARDEMDEDIHHTDEEET